MQFSAGGYMADTTYKLPPLTRQKVLGLRQGRKEARVCYLDGRPISGWLGRLRDVVQAAGDAVAQHGRDAVYLQISQNL